MRKLVCAAQKCTLMAVASGPIGLCGAIDTKCDWAKAAILPISSTPPTTQISRAEYTARAVRQPVLEDAEIGLRGAEVHVDGRRQRAHRIVRRYRHEMRLGQGRDLAHLEHAADHANIPCRIHSPGRAATGTRGCGNWSARRRSAR